MSETRITIRDEIEQIRTTFNALMAVKKRYLRSDLNEIQYVLKIGEIIDDGHRQAMELAKRGI